MIQQQIPQLRPQQRTPRQILLMQQRIPPQQEQQAEQSPYCPVRMDPVPEAHSSSCSENVKSGTYKVSRPFNIATKGDPDGLAKDFIDFILSEEGQAVVEENGYVSEGNTGVFEGTKPEGKITVGGSSSVTPVMEKLKEAYTAVNPNATIEVQQSDSTTGMTSTIDGTYDIGMASRELKDEEAAQLTPQVIALDGIAVIVNKENPITELTSEDVLNIYTGVTTDWSEIAQ